MDLSTEIHKVTISNGLSVLACVFNTDDGRWGAPKHVLHRLLASVAACSREVSLVVSLCDAKISAIESLSAFLKASDLGNLPEHCGPRVGRAGRRATKSSGGT